MSAVCLYFQVHQPYRLKRYTCFDIGRDHSYFDDAGNAALMRRVAHKCYLPANRIILDLINKHSGAFKVAFSISGTAIEQMREYCPEALASFRALAATGCVEFLCETYYHSLASVLDTEEFVWQATKHKQVIESEFGYEPTVFRNTELIYSDRIGRIIQEQGFKGVLAEGVDRVLGWRTPNMPYRLPQSALGILPKNYALSDDIAFRFSDRATSSDPLTAEKFAANIHALGMGNDCVGLFMDYETFGEHQWESTGIFDFLKSFPSAVLAEQSWRFLTPSEVLRHHPSPQELSYPQETSWADVARDLSAWQGNTLQKRAANRLYSDCSPAHRSFSEQATGELLAATWRKLQTSDHFYYMSTKACGDGVVHSYFSPYESPYDAFIAYMNVMRDFSERIEGSSIADPDRPLAVGL
jgi:alpha-amylase